MRKHGPDGHNRMGDAVEAINFYQEIGGRSGLASGDRTMADAILEGWGWQARVTLGEPKASAAWPGRLRLSQEQYELLLVAAAEYAELTDEVGEYESAVAFVDWCSVDALRDGLVHVEADGAPARLEGGMVADHRSRLAHRHPFPLAQAGLAPKMRRAR